MVTSGSDLKVSSLGHSGWARWRAMVTLVASDGWVWVVAAAAVVIVAVFNAQRWLPYVYALLVFEVAGEIYRILEECSEERILHGRRMWSERAALSPRVLTGLTGGLVLISTWPLLPFFYFGLVGPLIGQPTTWATLLADVVVAYSARSVVMEVPIPATWLVVGMFSAGATWCQFGLLRRSQLAMGLMLPTQLALSLVGAFVVFGEGKSLRDCGLALLATALVGLVTVRPGRTAFTMVDAAMVAGFCMGRVGTCVMVRGLELPHDRHDLIALAFRAAYCSVYLAPTAHLVLRWRALRAHAAQEMPSPGRGIALTGLAALLSAAGGFFETIAVSHYLGRAMLLEAGMMVVLLAPMTALYGLKYGGDAKARLREAWHEMGLMRRMAALTLLVLLIVWYSSARV